MPARPLVGLAAVAVALSGAARAEAADPCPKGATCGAITVPLDHSGAAPGTLPLAYARVPATGTRTGTIALLAGGPGQAGIPLVDSFARILGPLRASYDLLFVDQRGTGRSGSVDCKPLIDPAAASTCATLLGARRGVFTTSETVSDLEDLRAALGIDRLTLLGVSYGATVAGAYARRHPATTAAVVLDSPSGVDGLDAFDLNTFRAIPRMLRDTCTGLCRRTVGDAPGALRRAVARLRRGPVPGPYVFSHGRVDTVETTEWVLLDVVRAADHQPVLRAQLPAAIASLAKGDAAPLIHASELWLAPDDPSTAVNDARLAAGFCAEGTLPWAPDAPLAGRAEALSAYLAGLGPAPFAPFSTPIAYRATIASLCEVWPPTPRPAAIAAAGPDVPVLVLSGHDDLRTPPEDARRIAAQYPHATVIEVGGVGHSVLRSEPRGCAARALTAFLRGRAVGSCVREKPAFVAAQYTPASLGALPAGAVGGRPGQTLTAVSVTLAASLRDAEAFRNWYSAGRREPIPSQRSGYAVITASHLALHAAEWIRGVYVTGTIDRRGLGRVTVSGPKAAPGTLTFARGGVTGTLDGRRIATR